MSRSEDWILGDVEQPHRPKPAPAAEPKRALSRAQRKRRGGWFGRFALFLVWLVSFAAATIGLAFLATGVMRDSKYGDGRVSLDLSSSGSSRTAEFWPWAPGRYFLYIETLDRTDRDDEKRFGGRLEVVVSKPDGGAAIAEPFEPPVLDHRLNGGTEWTRLREFYVPEPSFDRWTATIKVEEGDAAFRGTPSALLVVRDRHLPGIDGLVNYELAWPAAGLFTLAFLVGTALARRGGTWIPALLSLCGLGAFFWLYTLVA